MSSRLMPPNPGARYFTVSTILSVSLVARQSGNASTLANSLKSIALPSMTGSAASGPISPRPRTAVPSVTTATMLPFDGEVPDGIRVVSDRLADPGDTRRVGHREVVARPQRRLRRHFDLAAEVERGTCDPTRARPRRPAAHEP